MKDTIVPQSLAASIAAVATPAAAQDKAPFSGSASARRRATTCCARAAAEDVDNTRDLDQDIDGANYAGGDRL